LNDYRKNPSLAVADLQILKS